VASVAGPDHVHGLLQRIGLTIGDAWIIASAISIMLDKNAASPQNAAARPTASEEITDPAG
jgi:hypothetical protein